MRQRGRRIHLRPVNLTAVAPRGVPPCLCCGVVLCGSDVLAAWALRTLTLVKRHGLTFAELVEGHLLAGGLVEEILVAVRCGDEAESLVPDEPLDRTVASSHVVSPRCTLAEARRARMVVNAPRLNRRGLQADA